MTPEDRLKAVRPRVVIEDHDEARAWLEQKVLEAAGYDVSVCGGGETHAGRQCLLARDGWCPFLDGADAVVCHLPPGEKLNVTRRIRDQYPGMVVVLDPEGVSPRDAVDVELLERNPVERPEPEPAIAQDIRAALRASPAPPEH